MTPLHRTYMFFPRHAIAAHTHHMCTSRWGGTPHVHIPMGGLGKAGEPPLTPFVRQNPRSRIARFLDQFGLNFVSNPCVVSPKGPKARDFGCGRILGGSKNRCSWAMLKFISQEVPLERAIWCSSELTKGQEHPAYVCKWKCQSKHGVSMLQDVRVTHPRHGGRMVESN